MEGDKRSPVPGTPTSGTDESAWMGGRALLLNFAFWTLFGVFTASNWLLSPVVERLPYPGRLIGKALITSYLWALLTPVIFWIAARFNPEHGPRLRRALVLLVLGLAVGLLVASVEAAIFPRLLPPAYAGEPATGWARVWSIMQHYYSTSVITFFVVLVAGFVSDTSRRYRARQREASQLQAERAELRAHAARLQAQSAELNAQLAEARLAVLRTQLNPHFLFNTLNAVSALVATDARGVRNMIALLSDLLRFSLKDSRAQEIPLCEELRLLALYLEILEIRYQDQLRTSVTVDPEAQEALVPTLILQPLVENAMKHGIDPAGGYGAIEVRADRVEDDLVLSVQDTGSGSGTVVSTDGGSGVGLRLTRERLSELYGSEQRLDLDSDPNGGTIARIVLPYHTREDVRLGGRARGVLRKRTMRERKMLRVLVVDDEPLGRRRLLDLLESEPDVEIVGTAADGAVAIEEIRRSRPDLVFLDVQMPRMSGLEVAREVGSREMPVTVFVTAYDEYALQAFDFAAVDYLVKPFRDDRFDEALRRARRMVEVESRERLHEQLLALLEGGRGTVPRPSAPTSRYLERIAVQMRGKMRVVPVAKVDYITASGAYAELHVGNDHYVIREPLQNLEEKLDPERFLRIHRSTIVRLDLVDALLRSEGSDYEVQLRGGVRLRVGRSRRDALEQRLGRS